MKLNLMFTTLKLTRRCENDFKEVTTIKNTKSLVEAKQQMVKDEFLKVNRMERNQTNKERKDQQDKDVFINTQKLHEPEMFENEVNKATKQKTRKRIGRMSTSSLKMMKVSSKRIAHKLTTKLSAQNKTIVS